MDARNFLKVQNFKLKVENFEFEDVKFMTSTQKFKIYKNFVSFLNNHFKPTSFKKDIYEHCHLHCGFIAHYNINGFYGEYFGTAARFHKIANGFEKEPTEYDGFYVGGLKHEGKDSLSAKQAFYQIYEELNGTRNGLGAFYDTIINNRNYGGYGDYADLDKAIKDAFYKYLETWRYEIKLAIKAYDKFSKDEEVLRLQQEQEEARRKAKELEIQAQKIEDKLVEHSSSISTSSNTTAVPKKQLSLFDLLEQEVA